MDIEYIVEAYDGIYFHEIAVYADHELTEEEKISVCRKLASDTLTIFGIYKEDRQ